jgi:hypothetical protein
MDFSLILFGSLAFIAGALSASNVVIEKLPNAKDMIAKLVPYQAMIGVAAFVFGVFKIFDIQRMRETMSTKAIFIVCVAACLVAGFLLGFPMIQKFIAEDEDTKEKVEGVRKKLSPYQVLAGLVALGTGAYIILMGLF